ncbi:MAG: lysine exporter LysO family protein [Desulfobacterales bacterium]|nr:lysine exporter LysO family protein [Desulfobacterales bacterium]
MVEILGIMALGMVLGFLLRRVETLFAVIDRIVMAVIFLLLFVLGISVGLNETVVSSIHKIGVDALVLTAGAIAGSIFCCGLVWKLFFARTFDDSTGEAVVSEVSHEG